MKETFPKKKCTKCKIPKGLTAFPIRLSKGKRRMHSWCKACRNSIEKYRKTKMRRKRLAYFKAFHSKNRDKRNTKALQNYYLKYRDKYIEKYRKTNVYHPELLKTHDPRTT